MYSKLLPRFAKYVESWPCGTLVLADWGQFITSSLGQVGHLNATIRLCRGSASLNVSKLRVSGMQVRGFRL